MSYVGGGGRFLVRFLTFPLNGSAPLLLLCREEEGTDVRAIPSSSEEGSSSSSASASDPDSESGGEGERVGEGVRSMGEEDEMRRVSMEEEDAS